MYFFMEAKNNKERYVAPMTDVVELQPTGILCSSPVNTMGAPSMYGETTDDPFNS